MINAEFDEYVETFKKLPLLKKKDLTIQEIKVLIALLCKLNKDLNVDDRILLNKEILDLQKDTQTEDDFVEAVFVYINIIKETLSNYLDVITDILYEEE